MGPLRLLAGEIYETLNSQGVYCSLITGQERQEFPFSTHAAATVEMAANLLDQEFDVVVIDEIQMIEDEERGFAWTRALIGTRCKEIHVCGGLEAKELVERIADACGDDFELNKYERFSELTLARKSLASNPDEMGSYKWVGAIFILLQVDSLLDKLMSLSSTCFRFGLPTVLSDLVAMTFLQSSVR